MDRELQVAAGPSDVWPEKKPSEAGLEVTETARARDSWIIVLHLRTYPLSH